MLRARSGRARLALATGMLLAGLVSAAAVVYSRQTESPRLPAARLAGETNHSTRDEMVWLSGGRFVMGNNFAPASDTRPAHEVAVDGFWLDAHEVTNRQFAEFVAATGYRTTAERTGQAWVFDPVKLHWLRTPGATWKSPAGAVSSIAGQDERPVVQVSWYDAMAYAEWALKRLPTEAEWEFAARSGLADSDYPWGREERPGGTYQANTWQGWFPKRDLGSDGFRSLAPVKSFPASSVGLYDMSGNAFEWCSDRYAEDYYQLGVDQNPAGPSTGADRVIRGGSWLSAENYTSSPKVWAREKQAPDSSFQHIGFRCAKGRGR